MRTSLLIIGLAVLILGCGQEQETNCITSNQDLIVGGTTGDELSATQVFRKNNGTEPGTLDPHRAEGVPASNVLRDLFEGLVMEDPSGRYIPGQQSHGPLARMRKHMFLKCEKN